MQQLFPTQAPVDDPLSIYERIGFPEPPVERPYLYLNMVSSVDGRVQVDEHAGGLGSRIDQALMQRLRALADCVLNGAGTANAEQVYRPLPPELVAQRRARAQSAEPLWALATASGQIRPDAKILAKPPPRPIVFVAEATPAEGRKWLAERADVVVAGEQEPDVDCVLRALRERYGCRLVLCEGGPTLNYSLLQAGVLDELFLTFAPKLVAGEGKTLLDGPQLPKRSLAGLDLVTLFEHESELFFRYRTARG